MPLIFGGFKVTEHHYHPVLHLSLRDKLYKAGDDGAGLLLATVNLFHIQSVGIRVPLGRSDVSNSHVKTTDVDGDRLAWRFFLFFGRFVLLGWLGLLFLLANLLFIHFLFLHLLLSFHRSWSRSSCRCRCWMRKNFLPIVNFSLCKFGFPNIDILFQLFIFFFQRLDFAVVGTGGSGSLYFGNLILEQRNHLLSCSSPGLQPFQHVSRCHSTKFS